MRVAVPEDFVEHARLVRERTRMSAIRAEQQKQEAAQRALRWQQRAREIIESAATLAPMFADEETRPLRNMLLVNKREVQVGEQNRPRRIVKSGSRNEIASGWIIGKPEWGNPRSVGVDFSGPGPIRSQAGLCRYAIYGTFLTTRGELLPFVTHNEFDNIPEDLQPSDLEVRKIEKGWPANTFVPSVGRTLLSVAWEPHWYDPSRVRTFDEEGVDFSGAAIDHQAPDAEAPGMIRLLDVEKALAREALRLRQQTRARIGIE